MTLQNRVQPDGKIITHAARGFFGPFASRQWRIRMNPLFP